MSTENPVPATEPAPVAPAAPPVAPPAPKPEPVAGLGPSGKTRGPVAVWLLSIITFGIYGLVWYYKTNRELRDLHPSIVVSPGLAVVCMFIPIVGLVSIYNTGKRVVQAQQLLGVAPVSPGLGTFLGWILYLHTSYYQAGLNDAWANR